MKLIATLIAASCSPIPAVADGLVEVDRIVAVMNSEVITRAELRQRIEQVTRQLTRQGTPLPPADVLERQVLERQIMERLQIQLANETSLRSTHYPRPRHRPHRRQQPAVDDRVPQGPQSATASPGSVSARTSATKSC